MLHDHITDMEQCDSRDRKQRVVTVREHPMRAVKRLKVDNRRTRILTEAEQLAVLAACPRCSRASSG